MNKFKIFMSPLGLALAALVLISMGASLFLPGTALWPSGVRADEDVVFFSTSASKNSDGSWSLPIHAWIFEREEGGVSRVLGRRFIGELMEQFGIAEAETRSKLFRQRITYFLVDNQRGKQLNIAISSLKNSAPMSVQLAKTRANGHGATGLTYQKNDKDGSWLNYSAQLPKGDHRIFMGQIKLVPPHGLSVICDIDDTIKVSNVLDKRELMRNSLFRPYVPVKTMSGHLWQLERRGAYFHYVSASPWQLYPSLKQFLDNHVPRGSISLRNFRLKDKSFFAFLGSSEAYKMKTIKAILKRYPKHQFVLIGDSSEFDPEIYGRLYRAFPQNIKAITIRRVEGSNTRDERFAKAFSGVPARVWDVRRFLP